jgi:hypothetical protein
MPLHIGLDLITGTAARMGADLPVHAVPVEHATIADPLILLAWAAAGFR